MKVLENLQTVQKVSRKIAAIDDGIRKRVLEEVATEIEKQTASLLAANQLDVAQMDRSDPRYDRLLLTPERLVGIANDLRTVAVMESPLQRIVSERTLDNGLHLQKVTVPIGVIGVIYEARPNVTFDVFALCFRSGNVAVLKGGSDAKHSNAGAVSLIQGVLERNGVQKEALFLLPPTREAVKQLLEAEGIVDVVIPRGSQALIDSVRKNARVPVIETGAGIVHTYLDAEVDLQAASQVITNAKIRRVSVCNALDCLLVHRSQIAQLGALLAPLAKAEVQLFVDSEALESLRDSYPEKLLLRADAETYGVEFLALKMAIRIVAGLEEALEHIATHSSKHSEAILSENQEHIERFLHEVDAAAVYANTSTAFTDGAQFGLGAEIGISTQKLHARGPMGLNELTSYKWIVRGNGQIRP